MIILISGPSELHVFKKWSEFTLKVVRVYLKSGPSLLVLEEGMLRQFQQEALNLACFASVSCLTLFNVGEYFRCVIVVSFVSLITNY